MKRTFITSAVATLLFTLIFIACYTNPITGRKSLMLVPAATELELGTSAFNDLKASTPISSNPDQNSQLQRVGAAISSVASLKHAQWEFVVFQEDNTPNAFCLPGGKVGIYTGILPLTQTDAGLATVVGHEVAHAVARHGGERMSEQLLINFGGVMLDEALKKKPKETRDTWLAVYGIGAHLGYTLPHSRKHELEADRMGLMYMAQAGFDPREAVAFWQRFKAWSDQRGGQGPEFLSTHPLDSRRIAELEKHMPAALAIYEGRAG